MKVAIIGIHGHMGQIHLDTAREWGAEIVGHPNDADVVVIASPDNTHAGYVKKYLAEWRPVFCEKPLATNPEDLMAIEKLAAGVPLGCHLPLRQFANEFEITGNFVYLVYDYGRREKFLNSWRNSLDYNLVMGGGIHLMDLFMLKIGTWEIKIVRTSHARILDDAGRLSNCSDMFFGRFDAGPWRGVLQVDFTKDGPHRHIIDWHHGMWINERPTNKKVQLITFLDKPSTDWLAFASHRACLDFRSAEFCLAAEKATHVY